MHFILHISLYNINSNAAPTPTTAKPALSQLIQSSGPVAGRVAGRLGWVTVEVLVVVVEAA